MALTVPVTTDPVTEAAVDTAETPTPAAVETTLQAVNVPQAASSSATGTVRTEHNEGMTMAVPVQVEINMAPASR